MNITEAKELVLHQYPDAEVLEFKTGYGQLTTTYWKIISPLCGDLGLTTMFGANTAWVLAAARIKPNSLTQDHT